MAQRATNVKYAIVDDHGELFGWYETREAAQADLNMLENPDDLAIIELKSDPSESALRLPALRMLARLGEMIERNYPPKQK